MDVFLILMNWIPQLIFVPIDILNPVVVVLSTIYFTLIKLCFNYKNTLFGNHNMVYLCCLPILIYKQVVDNLIFILW